MTKALQPDTVITSTRNVRIDELTPHPENPKRGDVDHIRSSLRRFGQYRPIVVQASTNYIIAGNHTTLAALAEGWTTIKATFIDVDDATARAILLADNRLSDIGTYEPVDLATLLQAVRSQGGIDGTGWEAADVDDYLAETFRDSDYLPDPPGPSLRDRFIIPPFTVLDARAGYWKDRKNAWLNVGIRSELGRQGNLTLESLSGRVPDYYNQKGAAEKRLGRELTHEEFVERHLVLPDHGLTGTGTSVFDPVLCEITYRWFSAPGAHVLDPFAGGSVRGIVAGLLDRDYTGVDLSKDQVDANADNWQAIRGPERGRTPTWIHGDSLTDLPDGPYDLVFSCPPYADLEVYSDNPRDLSTMDYDDFLDAYRRIIKAAVDRLRPNRFAAWTISDVRDRHGNYRGLPAATIDAFRAAGADYYNEAVLVTPLGNLPVTVARQFAAGRKLGRTHQNVLVFIKGDSAKAKKAAEAEFDDSRRLAPNHETTLIFVKGDPRKAAEAAGDVDVDADPLADDETIPE